MSAYTNDIAREELTEAIKASNAQIPDTQEPLVRPVPDQAPDEDVA